MSIQGEKKGDIQQLRNFNHKGKHNIRCYLKYLLVFTAYQLQGWWTMIISSVNAQSYGINVGDIIIKISWHTHLKHYMPYTFILQKVNKSPDGFCTHIFFALKMILIFGGIYLHILSRLLKVNLKLLKATNTYFARQHLITSRDNSNSSKPNWKARNKPTKGHTKNRHFVSWKNSKYWICHKLSSIVYYS